jgi:Uma2 family endonuclease
MATAAPVLPLLSPEEYLAHERQAAVKSEYFAGRTFAMAGASRAHNLLAGTFLTQINNRLPRARGCEAYVSDMRVKIPATGLYTYPDVSVACPPEFEDQQRDTLVNPVLIVEVLSDSTEAYDRGDKFEHYRNLPSLREYLLVSQRAVRVDHYVRQDDGTWLLRAAKGPDAVLTLGSLGCELPLAALYERVELPAPGPLRADDRKRAERRA